MYMIVYNRPIIYYQLICFNFLNEFLDFYLQKKKNQKSKNKIIINNLLHVYEIIVFLSLALITQKTKT